MHFSPFCIHWRGKLRNLLNRAKNIYIYLRYYFNFKSNGGAVVELQAVDPEIVGSPPAVFFSLPSHGAPSVKLRILQNFTLYLRNSWSINLRAIENCICGLRSIERNMRCILRTVHAEPISAKTPENPPRCHVPLKVPKCEIFVNTIKNFLGR